MRITEAVNAIRTQRDAEFWRRFPRLAELNKPRRLNKDETAQALLLEDIPLSAAVTVRDRTMMMKVLLTKPWKDSLFVELSNEILEFIRTQATVCEITENTGIVRDSNGYSGIQGLKRNGDVLRLRRNVGDKRIDKLVRIHDGNETKAIDTIRVIVDGVRPVCDDDDDSQHDGGDDDEAEYNDSEQEGGSDGADN